ncbi:MAG: Cytochrome c oxidase subunit 3 [Holosporales bacterium]
MTQKHPFHVVAPSPWPFCISMATFLLAVGGILAMHKLDYILFSISLLAVIAIAAAWFIDIIKESREKGVHTQAVQKGLKFGFILFVISELMLFISFFWSYFNAALFPVVYNGETVLPGVWPPKGIETVEAFGLPYLNTLILLLSGTSVTWAHHALKKNDMRSTQLGLLLTIILGLIFVTLQAIEYGHVTFNFIDGYYPTIFFMATGFHGAHVIVGILLLSVCYVRTFKEGDITHNHHVGFETSVWYWHFVDVIWIVLFCALYWWGGM